jgi:hypothetical protein
MCEMNPLRHLRKKVRPLVGKAVQQRPVIAITTVVLALIETKKERWIALCSSRLLPQMGARGALS